MTEARIEVRNLSKVFALSESGGRAASLLEALRTGQPGVNRREVRALQDVSFDIKHGERVGIIGANGAGKTTLLSILAGLTDATGGTMKVEGDIHAMLTIGDVLREDLTGRENIYLDASVHGRGREDIDAAVEEVIAFTELGEFIERPVLTYSSGMKARLAFAMGAFIDADVLILDETLSVGDFFFEKKAAARMRRIAEHGSIVIMVSHGLASIAELCTRCLWMEDGRLVMDGDPETVIKAYERRVQEADEANLIKKFGAADKREKRIGAASLKDVSLLQDGTSRHGSVMAMQPLTITINGTVGHSAGPCDLVLNVLRVDGRKIWQQCGSANGLRLPEQGVFRVEIQMDPFLLGASLYRLDVAVHDSEGMCDTASRVFEVVDEVGQYGGQPQLFYPPVISVRPCMEPGS